LAAAVGYVTYLLLFTKQSGSEMGSLESLGLSRLQAFGLLSFEHLTVSALGVALGTWAGFQMSTLIVAPLATTESGDPVVPPFILTTEWALLIVALAMLLGILVVSLIALTMGVRRINLQALSRLGGM
jgi:ABC-type antimicrobial peptide transport system permease subunit